MVAERDELTQRTFPVLRELCERNEAALSEIDLRWGVTEEQAAQGRIVELCLAEVDACFPWFIGLLGDRYGTAVPDLPETVLLQHPWLRDLVGRSIAEIEVRHALNLSLNRPANLFFYIREGAPTRPAGDLDIGARMLLGLKTDLVRANVSVRPYASVEDLGRLIHEDLASALEATFLDEASPGPVAAERRRHESFARAHSTRLLGREREWQTLRRHLTSREAPLAIVGEGGFGKTALLSMFLVQTWLDPSQPKTDHPDLVGRLFAAVGLRRASARLPAVIAHYAGVYSQEQVWPLMIARLVRELRASHSPERSDPDSLEALGPDELVSTFISELGEVATRRPVAVIIDGADRLGGPFADKWPWLPDPVPANVRLVLSVSTGESAEALRERGFRVMELQPFTEQQRGSFLDNRLRAFGKQLSPRHRRLLVEADAAGSPAFLAAAAEELRIFGDHARLEERIRHYVHAPSVEHLLGLIIDRLDEHLGDQPASPTMKFLGLVSCARHGLSDRELRELLGSPGRPMDSIVLSPVELALRAWLTPRDGLIRIVAPALRDAVARRLTAEERMTIHQRLAGYFSPRPPGQRALDELPWHLAHSRQWRSLADVLCDPPFLTALFERDTQEPQVWWSEIEANSALRLPEVYAALIEHPDTDQVAAQIVASLLRQTGRAGLAVQLFGRLLQSGSGQGQARNAMEMNYALALRESGMLDEALAVLSRLDGALRTDASWSMLASCLGNKAVILEELGAIEAAALSRQEEQAVCMQLGLHGQLQTSRFNEGRLLARSGRTKEAAERFREYEKWAEQCGDLRALQAALANRAVLMRRAGKYREAADLHQRERAICERLGDVAALLDCLGNLAEVSMLQSDFDAADALLAQQEELFERSKPPRAHVQHMLIKSRLYRNIGLLDDAATWAQLALEAAESQGLVDLKAEAVRLTSSG